MRLQPEPQNGNPNPSNSLGSILDDSKAKPRPPRPPQAHIDDHAAESVPPDLVALKRWVTWAWTWSADKSKWDKPPVHPQYNRQIDQTDPANWMTFDEARGHCSGAYPDGVGFALGSEDQMTGFVGIDIDNCIGENGEISPRAMDIVRRFNSYTEFTPSGNGLRILIRAKKPGTRCNIRKHPDTVLANLEIYERDRYITVTGRRLEDSPAAMAVRQKELDALYAEMFEAKAKPQVNGRKPASEPVDDSDDALLARARKAANGTKFSALYDQGDAGEYGGNTSSADMGLMSMLAFWTRRDSARMERLFDASALGRREKWTDRPDYRQRTVQAAIDECDEVYTPMAKKARASKNGNGNGDASHPAPTRPTITVSTLEHEVIDQAVMALSADPNLFQRGGWLVSILEDVRPQPKRGEVKRASGSLRIATLPTPQVRRLMTLNADWEKIRIVKGEPEPGPAHPPAWAIDGVATLGNWPGIRPLEGLVEAPTLRADGSLLDRPGYDPDTGLWFAPSGDFPAIPEGPTRDDAKAAAKALRGVVNDFPFASEDHFAAYLAGLLTALARFAIDGPCPLFLFDANCAGTGKSKLADIIAILATGREMARGAYPDDQAEMEKMLLSVVKEGDRFLLFDNVATGFSVGGSAIDRALTARTMKGRVLGKSEMTPELPVNVTFYATGNNLGIRGDALRRVIPCRLETPEERPEERTGFAIEGDLLAYVKQHRGRLVAAALTILRAYIVAGRPDPKLTPMDYPAWCGLIRNAVHWVTGDDPCSTRKDLTASDEETQERKIVVAGWEALVSFTRMADPEKAALTVAEARDAVERDSTPPAAALRDLFMSWSRDGKLPSAKSIGKRIAKFRDRNCDGKCLKRTTSEPVAWYVRPV